MKINNSRIHILKEPRRLESQGKTGVSLHCHTLFSRETLDFLPYYADKIPLVRHVWKREIARYERREGKSPDFNTGYWQPPLTGHQVFGMEKDQMNRAGLDAIVSITDHDSISGNLEINRDIDNTIAPISMEWTVPFGRAYFHLGIHNLPAAEAIEIKTRLIAYTFAAGEPDNNRLHEIFEMLNAMPEVLIVFNHPIWDIEMIGQHEHIELLESFIADHSHWLHAIEINGFRPWSENRAAMAVAELLDLPLISGGDRHCLHSNTMINVTGSASFSEFVEEIRADKFSHIAVFPEYQKPLVSRQIASMAQILGYHPEFPEGRRRWYERVYFDAKDGAGERSLASHWTGHEPVWHEWAIRLLSMLGHRSLHPFFRLAVDRADFVPRESRTSEPLSIIGQNPLTAER